MLFLHLDPPNGPPAKALETPEGHTANTTSSGATVRLGLMGVLATVERDGELKLT